MNEVNALVWPNRLGVGVMDPASFASTADIAFKFGVINKRGIQGGISLGSGQEGSRRPEEAGHRRLRKEVEEVGRQADGRREVRRDGRERSACPF